MKLQNKIKYNLHIDYSAFMYIVPQKTTPDCVPMSFCKTIHSLKA